MKHFISFIICFTLLIFCLPTSYMFSRTRDGQRYEYFKSASFNNLPEILTKYLGETGIRFSTFKIPNFVRDFLTYNSDFSLIYSSKPKYSILIFSPEKNTNSNYNSFNNFYKHLSDLVLAYNDSFNLYIVEEQENKKNYPLKYDRDAYKELREHCQAFCFIDPNEDLLFIFSKITDSEVDALDVLFQEYDYKFRNQ